MFSGLKPPLRRFTMKVALFTACILGLTPALPALAQQSEGDAAVQTSRLQAIDSDKDGTLSKSEWTAAGRPERAFAAFDADRDGKLTPAEIRKGLEKSKQRRGRTP